MTFPGIDSEKAWNIATNWSNRFPIDDRLEEGQVIDENDEHALCFWKRKKPPIPLFSQRDFLVEFHKVKNVDGQGKHIMAGINRVHDSKPVQNGFFANVRACVHIQSLIIGPIDPSNPSAGSSL
jgi:hypothetical protein